MAEKPVKVETDNFGVVVVTWTDLDDGDTGKPVAGAHFSDKTVQLSTDGGGSVAMQGSNDGVNWGSITSADGVNPLVVDDLTVEVIIPNPRYIRPLNTGGANNVVILVAKATR